MENDPRPFPPNAERMDLKRVEKASPFSTLRTEPNLQEHRI
ncbi:hypothetical protein SF06_33080 [Pseudomonas flexibilis]|nr:hypothetical protein SF06_33080 [Pseudomonas flexibilis]